MLFLTKKGKKNTKNLEQGFILAKHRKEKYEQRLKKKKGGEGDCRWFTQLSAVKKDGFSIVLYLLQCSQVYFIF